MGADAARKLYVAEPPATYLLTPPLVVDCSLLAAMLFQEPGRADAENRVTGRSLHAPALLDFEIVSVAVRKSRQGRTDIACDGVSLYRELPIELHQADLPRILDLAEHYQLSAYDASYLWLAAELKAPLATFDRRLGVAATLHLGALE